MSFLLGHIRRGEIFNHTCGLHLEYLARFSLVLLASSLSPQLGKIEVEIVRQISKSLAHLDCMDLLRLEVCLCHYALAIPRELLDFEASHDSLHALGDMEFVVLFYFVLVALVLFGDVDSELVFLLGHIEEHRGHLARQVLREFLTDAPQISGTDLISIFLERLADLQRRIWETNFVHGSLGLKKLHFR